MESDPPSLPTRVVRGANDVAGPLSESHGLALRRVSVVVALRCAAGPRARHDAGHGAHRQLAAADFHHEIYPQAKLLLDGVNPYP